MNVCKCGCGNKTNKGKSYVWGHNRKGVRMPWSRDVNKRAFHERANKIISRDKCFMNNNDCKGNLEIAHIDGNHKNNSEDNLACLCQSHHKILDNRRLSLEELESIVLFYRTDRGGKRRYKNYEI